MGNLRHAMNSEIWESSFLRIYFYLETREKERIETEIFSPQVHFPNGQSDLSWTFLKPGAANLLHSPTWKDTGPKDIGHPLLS